MTEPQQTEQVPEGALVCLPVAEHDALTALVRDLAAMPRSVLECLVPPLPGRLARAINVGGGGEVER